MSAPLQAAERIRSQLDTVAALRQQAHHEGLGAAVAIVKQLQASRFRATYADVLLHPQQGLAAHFFLDRLYGDHDFADRDVQFGRIAGALERMFPGAVIELAIDLAEMHALTETLDHTLATHWLALGETEPLAERYVRSWRLTAQRPARERQLMVVRHIGLELQRMTRSKSLLLALKMMRRPAKAAGMSALQQFLEDGFAAFAALGDAGPFLTTVEGRERRWIERLFDEPMAPCASAFAEALRATGAQSRS